MRTTIIIDDMFTARIGRLAAKRSLSQFINDCLREHFEKEEKRRRFVELEKAYGRASKGDKLSQGMEAVDIEGWPEW